MLTFRNLAKYVCPLQSNSGEKVPFPPYNRNRSVKALREARELFLKPYSRDIGILGTPSGWRVVTVSDEAV